MRNSAPLGPYCTVGLCPRLYGGPRGGAVSCERDTPVDVRALAAREHHRRCEGGGERLALYKGTSIIRKHIP